VQERGESATRASVRPRELAICGTEAVRANKSPARQGSSTSDTRTSSCEVSRLRYHLSRPQLYRFLDSDAIFCATMPPLPGGYGGIDADAIDLTLSSPEPQQRPRFTPQQQRVSSYFKPEPRNDPSHARRIKSERGAPSMMPSGSRTHQRTVDPQHLANIVRSTDYQVVEALLLDLCSQSPALSGAVARGLAPHSTFARSIINKHVSNPVASSSRQARDSQSHGQEARDRMKKRLVAQHAARASSQNRAQQSSSAVRAHGVRSVNHQSATKIKRERHLERADSDSDLDQYIPRDFPVSSNQATRHRLPLSDAPSSHVTGGAPTPSSSLPAHIRGYNKAVLEFKLFEPKPCIQCHETVEEEDVDGMCFYHAGPLQNINGRLTCGNCQKAANDIGCAFGTHVTAPNTNLDATMRDNSNRTQFGWGEGGFHA
jgi:hypothetical protein